MRAPSEKSESALAGNGWVLQQPKAPEETKEEVGRDKGAEKDRKKCKRQMRGHKETKVLTKTKKAKEK